MPMATFAHPAPEAMTDELKKMVDVPADRA